jgi:hypothetical protein
MRPWLAVLVAVFVSLPAHGAGDGSNPDSGRFMLKIGSGSRVQGSGRLIEETRAVSGFAELELRAPVAVTLKSGASERVTVQGDENIVPLIQTRVVDGRLEIGTRRGALFVTRQPIKATVEFTQLNAIRVRGSGDVRGDLVRTAVLQIVIGGSGGVAIDRIEVNALAVSVAGSGDVVARGRAESVGVVVEGSGDVKLADVEAKQAAVRIRGSGDVAVNAVDRLEVDLAGTGDVRYRGSPRIRKQVHGTGSVAPL